MLRRLSIRNLAIVEDVSIELGPGLTVVTGETGAGKSILVDALTLVAGGRGSSDLLRQGADRLTVSGEFDSDASISRLGLWVDGHLVAEGLARRGDEVVIIGGMPVAGRARTNFVNLHRVGDG